MNFADIAIISKEINKNYMIEKIPVSITSSKPNVRSIYSYIKQIHGGKLTVLINKLHYNQMFIFARLQRYPGNRAEIYYSDTLNNCWSRYICAEELVHLILDKNEASFTVDIEMIVNWMISGLGRNISDSLDSEHCTAILAAELLVPYDQSQKDLKDSTISTEFIASKFLVPKEIIETMRSPLYLEQREKSFED